jgi:dihydrofolate reductase
MAGRDPQCIHSIERENLMGSTLLNMTVSLDGFGAGEHIDVEHPLGVGGERLHDWIFTAGGDRSVTAGGTSPGGVDAQVMRELAETTGAVLIGRRTFDVGLGHWQDTPYPLPCVVLTHETRSPMAMTSASFTFVTSGIADAVEQARKFAGEKNVLIMGGADVGQQALRAGLVDEIQIQLVPVLIGAGTRLFDHLGTDRIELERTRTIESPYVTHLRFRVVG